MTVRLFALKVAPDAARTGALEITMAVRTPVKAAKKPPKKSVSGTAVGSKKESSEQHVQPHPRPLKWTTTCLFSKLESRRWVIYLIYLILKSMLVLYMVGL